MAPLNHRVRQNKTSSWIVDQRKKKKKRKRHNGYSNSNRSKLRWDSKTRRILWYNFLTSAPSLWKGPVATVGIWRDAVFILSVPQLATQIPQWHAYSHLPASITCYSHSYHSDLCVLLICVMPLWLNCAHYSAMSDSLCLVCLRKHPLIF